MRWLGCVALLALMGCGGSTAIQTKHEGVATLAGKTTYAFSATSGLNEEGFTTGHLFNAIMQRRIQDELSKELAMRGFTPSPVEGASILVSFTAGGRQDVVTAGDQKGPVVEGSAYTTDRGALVLHFVDAQTKKVLWRGWGEAVMHSDDDFDKVVRAAVREIMVAFPASKS